MRLPSIKSNQFLLPLATGKRGVTEDKQDIKEKAKKIYEVLLKLDDSDIKLVENLLGRQPKERRHVMDVLVVERRRLAKVCEIMGARVPEQAIPQFGPDPGFYQPGLSAGRGMGWGLGRGGGMGCGGRGFGRGRRER